MKKLVLGLFLVGNSIILSANNAYDIDKNEYQKYKDNPKEMLSLFKKKFLQIQEAKKSKKEKISTDVNKKIMVKKEVKEEVVILPQIDKKIIHKEVVILPKIEEKVAKKQIVITPTPVIKEKIVVIPKVKKKMLKKEEIVQVKKNKKIAKKKIALVPIISMKKENLTTVNNKKKEIKIEKKPKRIKKTIIVHKQKKEAKKTFIAKKDIINDNKYPIKSLINKVEKPKIKREIKENKYFIMAQVIKKLNYTNIQKEKRLDKLIRNIDIILKRKNISYDNKELESVLKNINSKKISSFESSIYLEQIKNLIKG